MKKFILFNGLMLTLYTSIFAQLNVTAEIRPRAEYRDGFKTFNSSETEAAFFIEQRTRLITSYKNEKLSIKLSFQDVRFWGGTSQIYKTDNALLNFNEAWAAYELGGGSLLKFGRQELNYDNARILGNLAWAQQSRSHDLLKYEYKGENGFKWHAGLAFNQETVNSRPEPARLFDTFYSGVNNYKTLQFSWLNQIYDSGNVSILLLRNGFQSPDSTVSHIQTIGTFLQQNLGGPNLTFEGYYQFGENVAGTDVNAYMIALALQFKLRNHSLEIGGDLLSGTDPGDSEVNAFAPLFGTNHKFYGLMDYFFVGNPHGNIGLMDVYLKSNWKLGEKSSLAVHLHQFNAPVDIRDADGGSMPGSLGHELDLVYKLTIAKGIVWNLGFSMLQGTDTLGMFKSGNSNTLNYWGWSMITFKPALFSGNEG